MGKKTAKQMPVVVEAAANVPAVQDDPLKGELKLVGGSKADVWNTSLINQALRTAPKSADFTEQAKQNGDHLRSFARHRAER